MRVLLCLLAVALLAAAPVHSRQLKFDFPAPSPSSSPSQSDGPTSQCVDAYNAVVDNQTGACRDGAKLSSCCTALAGLGQTCLQSIVTYMEHTPEKHADTLKWLDGVLKQCTDGPGPSTDGPTKECVDSFNAFVDSGVCSKGAPLSKCCAAMAALGSCLDAIEAAMETEPEKYADSLAAIKATRKECGGVAPPTTEPTEQCIADFNAAMDGPCGKSGSVDKCCAALKGLGSCLESIVAAMSAQGDKYAESLKWLESMAQQCGSGPGPNPTPNVDEKCLKGLTAAFDNGGACAGSSASACCDSLESLGKDCLTSFLAATKQDNITVHDAFVGLLQSCGWTVTTSSSGARAAPEVTTQAMLRMKSAACPLCGAVKLEAAPQAARRALAETTFAKLDQPATKVAPTPFSKALA